MKLKILAASLAIAYGSLHAQVQTGAWLTSEYDKGRTLSGINAAWAYSRGYSGKGSTIAIIDSGIDAKSAEFQNRIKAVYDFTGSGSINDTLGHGTHVAGIAAAAKNNIGTHGVAFNADLLVAKVTTSGLVLMTTVNKASAWANSYSADVANFSLGFSLRDSAIAPTLVSPGIYKTNATNTGKTLGGLDLASWRSAVNGEMVLVVAAGNDNTPWSGSLSQLATATDTNGNLLLGGRVIVAGNWNSQGVTKAGKTTYSTGPNNNGSATLCMVMVGTVCQDKFKVSDFYLLAPGTGITSTFPIDKNRTGLSTLTGTSQAAPAISGAAAIVKEMWPQMTGSNIVKLLLVTANKNIEGYNVYLHGQGLLDLDKATRPVGNLGIPTTGRLTGPRALPTNPILVTGGSASTGGVGSIIVLDDFDRDFGIDAKFFTARKTTKEFNPVQAFMPYDSKNSYSLLNNYNQRLSSASGNLELSVYQDTNNANFQVPGMIEVAYKVHDFKFTAAHFTEQSTWLSNSFVGSNRESSTLVLGLGIDTPLSEKSRVYANAMNGITSIKSFSDKVTGLDTAYSWSWTAGLERDLDKIGTIGLMAYQPVSVYNASANVNMPVGIDQNLNVIQSTRTNLAADTKETRLGLYWKYTDNNSYASAFVETRYNYQGENGQKDTAVAFRVGKTF